MLSANQITGNVVLFFFCKLCKQVYQLFTFKWIKLFLLKEIISHIFAKKKSLLFQKPEKRNALRNAHHLLCCPLVAKNKLNNTCRILCCISFLLVFVHQCKLMKLFYSFSFTCTVTFSVFSSTLKKNCLRRLLQLKWLILFSDVLPNTFVTALGQLFRRI